jgi:hypothetical protein
MWFHPKHTHTLTPSIGHNAKKDEPLRFGLLHARRCSRFQALSERAHANPNIHSALRLSLAAAPVPLLNG